MSFEEVATAVSVVRNSVDQIRLRKSQFVVEPDTTIALFAPRYLQIGLCFVNHCRTEEVPDTLAQVICS